MRNEPLLGKRFKYNPNLYKKLNYSAATLESQSKFRLKVKDGIYKYENCVCYCGSKEESILLSETDAYGNYYPFVICKNCGIMRANPRLTKQSLIDFYTYDYRALYQYDDKDKDLQYEESLKEGQRVYDFITKHIALPPNAGVFDIGCNMGAMLLPFSKNGYKVMGVDYGVEYIEYGRKKMRGIKLEIGGVKKLKDNLPSFGEKTDLIILNHVFEHFLDIDEELKQIREVMKPDAYIYVSVPGIFWWVENWSDAPIKGNIMQILQNAHTYQFSLETLKYVMECNGFELIFGNEEIISIFKNTGVIKRGRQEVCKGEFDKVYRFLKRLESRYLPKYFLIKMLEKIRLKNTIKKFITH